MKEKLTWQNCTPFVSDHRSVYIQFFKFCQSCQQNVQMTYCKSKKNINIFTFFLTKEPLVKVSDKLERFWKHSLVTCVPNAFLLLPDFHLCFNNSIETGKMFFFGLK